MIVRPRNGAMKGHGTKRAEYSGEAHELRLRVGLEGSGC